MDKMPQLGFLENLLLGYPTAPILEEIRQIDFEGDGSGALMAVPPCSGIPTWLPPRIMEALGRLELMRSKKALHVMINKLPPDTIVPTHTDTLAPIRGVVQPKVERWHLPVQTNPHCLYWESGRGWDHMPVGYWSGPVQYWAEHSVENTGKTERIHIVVDLDPGE